MYKKKKIGLDPTNSFSLPDRVALSFSTCPRRFTTLHRPPPHAFLTPPATPTPSPKPESPSSITKPVEKPIQPPTSKIQLFSLHLSSDKNVKSSADDVELQRACEAAIEGTKQEIVVSIRVAKSRGIWGKSSKLGRGHMAKRRFLALSINNTNELNSTTKSHLPLLSSGMLLPRLKMHT